MEAAADRLLIDARVRETDELAAGLVRHFSSAQELLSSRAAGLSKGDKFQKECLWLYKQSYNSAVDGTRNAWPEPAVYGLFEIALSVRRSASSLPPLTRLTGASSSWTCSRRQNSLSQTTCVSIGCSRPMRLASRATSSWRSSRTRPSE